MPAERSARVASSATPLVPTLAGMVEAEPMQRTDKRRRLHARFPHLEGWSWPERQRWLTLLRDPDAQAIHAHQRAAAARRRHRHRDRRIHDDRIAGRSLRRIARDYDMSKSGVEHILARGRRNERLLCRAWIEHPTPYPWLPNKRINGRFGVRERVSGLPVFAWQEGVQLTGSSLRGRDETPSGRTGTSPRVRARGGPVLEIVPDYGQEAKRRRRSDA